METSRIRHALSSVQLFIERVPDEPGTAGGRRRRSSADALGVDEALPGLGGQPQGVPVAGELAGARAARRPVADLQGDHERAPAGRHHRGARPPDALARLPVELEEIAKLEPCGDPRRRARRPGASGRRRPPRRPDRRAPGATTSTAAARTVVDAVGADRARHRGQPGDPGGLEGPAVPLLAEDREGGQDAAGAGSRHRRAPADDLGPVKTSQIRSQPPEDEVAAGVLCWSEYFNGLWQPARTSDVDRPTRSARLHAAGAVRVRPVELRALRRPRPTSAALGVDVRLGAPGARSSSTTPTACRSAEEDADDGISAGPASDDGHRVVDRCSGHLGTLAAIDYDAGTETARCILTVPHRCDRGATSAPRGSRLRGTRRSCSRTAATSSTSRRPRPVSIAEWHDYGADHGASSRARHADCPAELPTRRAQSCSVPSAGRPISRDSASSTRCRSPVRAEDAHIDRRDRHRRYGRVRDARIGPVGRCDRTHEAGPMTTTIDRRRLPRHGTTTPSPSWLTWSTSSRTPSSPTPSRTSSTPTSAS